MFRFLADIECVCRFGLHSIRQLERLNAGLKSIEAEVFYGTREDATWNACGDNNRNGRRMTSADKRKAATVALGLPGAEFKSSREIAEHCGCSHTLVLDVLREQKEQGEHEDDEPLEESSSEESSSSGDDDL